VDVESVDIEGGDRVSVEILLIPAAMAAVAAWNARAEQEADRTCVVTTRMRDPELLAQALSVLGARTAVQPGVVHGSLPDAEVRFSWGEDGLVSAHVAGDDEAAAERLVRLVDAEYAALVQAKVYAQLQQRADALGMTVESEQVHADNSITLVLNVGQLNVGQRS
jgi:hypothetical protein